MTNYKHLSKSDRQELFILKERGYSYEDIGKAIGKNKSTISREIKRNSVALNVKGKSSPEERVYLPDKAEYKKYVRRKYSKREVKKIPSNPEVRRYVDKKQLLDELFRICHFENGKLVWERREKLAWV